MKPFILTFCLIIFSPAFVFSGDKPVNEFDGMDWNGFSKMQKLYIIMGIWIGNESSCLDESQDYKYRHAENTFTGDYMKELDKFYSKPKYRKIKILGAYVLATIKFQDSDSNDYKYILDLLLKEKTLPYFVKVAQVIDGDTIEVKHLFGGSHDLWRVRLIGIDTPEINHKSQRDKEKYGMKAKRFLEALCLDQKGELNYTDDIFDKYGRLLAQFKLNFDDPISKKLLQYGLAKPYPYRDPKRTEKSISLVTIDVIYARDAELAQQKHLYIWGGKKDPYVERTINQHLAK